MKIPVLVSRVFSNFFRKNKFENLKKVRELNFIQKSHSFLPKIFCKKKKTIFLYPRRKISYESFKIDRGKFQDSEEKSKNIFDNIFLSRGAQNFHSIIIENLQRNA